MSCSQCRGRDYLCQQCKMDELERRYGMPSDNFQTTADQIDRSDRDSLPYQCSNCQTMYETAGERACPDCGSSRRRYVGPMPEGTA